MKNARGFTLIEVMIVIAIIGILSVVAVPTLTGMWRDATYREAARNILYLTREARSLTIESNLEHRVEIELTNARMRLTRLVPNGSWSTPADIVTVRDWDDFDPNLTLKSGVACTSNSDIFFSFNPNGSSGNNNICVMTTDGTPRYRVGISFANTGRAKIDRYPFP